MAALGVDYDFAWNGSELLYVSYDTVPAGATVEFAESFEAGGDVFQGTISAGFGVSASIDGKIGIGGSVSTSAGSASLSNTGIEGKQGFMAVSLSDLIHALSGGAGVQGGANLVVSQVEYSGAGNAGNAGTAALTLESLIPDIVGAIGSSGILSASTGINMGVQGLEGKQGQLTGGISISAALFGSFGDAQIVFEGAMGATLSAFESEISGGAGVGGALSTQIITASMLTGLLGASGSYTISLDNLAAYIDGLSGVSGQISASISSGADLAAKLGISGEIVTSLDNLSLQLIEIVMSDRIYQIVISTKTGQAVFLAPKFGTIEMITEN